MKNLEKNILKYKEEYKKNCNNIEKIENQIKVKLSNIIISSVDEIDSVSRQLGSVDEKFLDVDYLEIRYVL